MKMQPKNTHQNLINLHTKIEQVEHILDTSKTRKYSNFGFIQYHSHLHEILATEKNHQEIKTTWPNFQVSFSSFLLLSADVTKMAGKMVTKNEVRLSCIELFALEKKKMYIILLTCTWIQIVSSYSIET